MITFLGRHLKAVRMTEKDASALAKAEIVTIIAFLPCLQLLGDIREKAASILEKSVIITITYFRPYLKIFLTHLQFFGNVRKNL